MGVATTTHAQRKALERAAKLAEVRRQVEAGELVVRRATPAERASWPPPRAPLPTRHGAAPPVVSIVPRWRPADVDALRIAAVEVLRHAAPEVLGARPIERAVRALPQPPRVSSRVLRKALGAWAADASCPIVAGPSGRGGYTVGEDGQHG